MQKRHLLRASAAAAIALSTGLAVLPAVAQDNVFKIGLVLPMTGQQATTGRQIEAAARLYMAQNRRHGGWQEGAAHHQGRHQSS